MSSEKVQIIRRKDAARLLDKILVELASFEEEAKRTRGMKVSKEIEELDIALSAQRRLETIRELTERARLTPLQPCTGEAHSNPHIDNCSVCMPRWGYTGPTVKIT